MRRPPGRVDAEVTALLTEQAKLRVLTKTLKQIAHSTGLNKSTVQRYMDAFVKRERQKVAPQRETSE